VDVDELEMQVSRVGVESTKGLRGQAIDGKEVRGARSHGRKVHLVSLTDQESGVVLAQVQVEEKTNEIKAVPELIMGRDLHGVVITVDALLTQREIARQILEQGGDYLMVVKDNQALTREAIADLFADEGWQRYLYKPYWTEKTFSKGHGRYETRVLESTTDANEYLSTEMNWPQVGQALRRTTKRVSLRTGKVSTETSYAITSLRPQRATAKELERLWRGHWTIENQVHYVRDVTMREDANQAHVGSTPQAMAAIRNAIINILRRAGFPKIPDALRHFNAQPHLALQLISNPRL
jgi:predicted transposase YbfD/YdcC